MVAPQLPALYGIAIARSLEPFTVAKIGAARLLEHLNGRPIAYMRTGVLLGSPVPSFSGHHVQFVRAGERFNGAVMRRTRFSLDSTCSSGAPLTM